MFGSLVGSFASIASVWLTQHYQKTREKAQAELRRRETLYGEFVTEAARLTVDAFDHSLEHAEKLTTLYALLGRIHLVASDPVYQAAKKSCNYIVDIYSKENLTMEQIYAQLRVSDHPLGEFATACRVELDEYVHH